MLDRRSGVDRREFSYTVHIPERRRGAERRKQYNKVSGKDGRNRIERGVCFRN